MEIVIDPHSGFCFGVVSAIHSAEKELEQSEALYCLGDIVHNGMEVNRLSRKGLKIISYQEFVQLSGCKVLIRAHGEPPLTYKIAKNRKIKLLDATCPIVLKLQEKVRIGYSEMQKQNGQIVIYGTKGHAEVLALQGQTNDTAVVISNLSDLELIDFTRPIRLYSQTTKSKEDYNEIIAAIKERISTQTDFVFYNTICTKVANRAGELKEFAHKVDILIFTSGKNSSNGLYLYKICKQVQPNSYLISDTSELQKEWFYHVKTVGITGATSTPMWLMQEVSDVIKNFETEI